MWSSRHGVLTRTAEPSRGREGEKGGMKVTAHQDTRKDCGEEKEARRQLRKSHRLTQVMIGSLQSRTAFSQNVHLKHRLWFHLHSEGGDGALIDAFSHVVIQAFNQLLNITAEVLQALSVLRLQGREMHRSHQKRAEGGNHLSTEPE